MSHSDVVFDPLFAHSEPDFRGQLDSLYVYGAAAVYLLDPPRSSTYNNRLVAYNTGPTRLNRYIRDAGGWPAWRDEREAAGDSDLLAYARKVMISRDHFALKGLLD